METNSLCFVFHFVRKGGKIHLLDLLEVRNLLQARKCTFDNPVSSQIDVRHGFSHNVAV